MLKRTLVTAAAIVLGAGTAFAHVSLQVKEAPVG